MACSNGSNGGELTSRVAAYLDPHMVLPLLDFLEPLGVYKSETVQASRLNVLQDTNMVDFYNELYKELYGEDKVEGLKPREPVVEELTRLQNACLPLLDILADKQAFADMRERQALTRDALRANYDITEAHIEALYDYAKFTFDCGRYHAAAEYLFVYRVLSTNEERCFLALWGQLAADILLTHWDDALEGLNQLGETIDNMTTVPQITQLRYRTWLIHWGLFIFFNHRNGRASLIEFLYKDRYMNAVQTSCPHILRYLTTAVIINQRRRTVVNELVQVIEKLKYVYQDPITNFLKAVFYDHDFEMAHEMLLKCDEVLSNDFFLLYIKDEFVECARVFYFEMYCRVHNTVSLRLVADTLDVSLEDAEGWIVDLIRTAGLDARIDSATGQVVMQRDFPNVYRKLIDKTRSLNARTSQLVGLVDKKYMSLQN